MQNYLLFGKDHIREYPLIEMSYLNSSDAIKDFLGGDIQYNIQSCSEWIDMIKEAENEINFFYESFGNCCTITITSHAVTIRNEYTNQVSENIKLRDMSIILEKWLEQIKTGETIEFSW